PYDEPAHAVRVEEGSRLAGILGAREAEVNTVHHQAADELGSGLKVTARAPDGIVEAIESTDGWAVGVQWHPERMDRRYDPGQLTLFQALVEAAQGRAR